MTTQPTTPPEPARPVCAGCIACGGPDCIERPVTVHACPTNGSGLTPCCGRTPLELPHGDCITNNPAAVTCTPTTPAARTITVTAPTTPTPGLSHAVGDGTFLHGGPRAGCTLPGCRPEDVPAPECRASTSGTCLNQTYGDAPCVTEDGECIHGGIPTTPAPHACGNCEGIDPDTCLVSPDRQPVPVPAVEIATEDEASGPDPAETVPCPATVLRQPHPVHEWAPQPGMDLVVCRGYGSATERLRDGRRLPTTPAPVDPALTQRIAEAIRTADSHSCGENEGADYPALAAAVLAELAPELARAETRRAQIARAAGLPEDTDWLETTVAIVKHRQDARRLGELVDRLGPTEQKQRHRAEKAETALTEAQAEVQRLNALVEAQREVIERQAREALNRDAEPRQPRQRKTARTALTGPAEENQP